jgi:hypothetical protein
MLRFVSNLLGHISRSTVRIDAILHFAWAGGSNSANVDIISLMHQRQLFADGQSSPLPAPSELLDRSFEWTEHSAESMEVA